MTSGKPWPDVRVLTFPSDDRAFREHVVLAHERSGRWVESRVMDRVREAYPLATATQAADVAVLEAAPRWYVYRDGHARARHGSDAWEDDPSTAVAVIDDRGRYVDVNDATAALFGCTRDQIVGRTAGDFTRHEDDEDLGPRLLALAAGDRLTSTAVVRAPTGDERPIEFSVRRSASGYTVRMRPISPSSEATSLTNVGGDTGDPRQSPG